MNWFRLYAEARTDKKLESLSDAEFRTWFNLLCYASEQPERGVIGDWEPDLLALEVAGGQTALLTETLAHLTRLRIVTVTDEAISFLHWLDRQYDKPSDQPPRVRERVARHRAHAGNAPEPPPPGAVTPPPADAEACNAPVTPGNAYTQNREYTEQIRSDQIAPPVSPPALPVVACAAPAARSTGPPAVDNFAPFAERCWAAYPARHGKKLHKADFLRRLKALPSRDWDGVEAAIGHYAASSTAARGYAEDPHRFLTHWQDWATPESGPGPEEDRHEPYWKTADERRAESFAAWGRLLRGDAGDGAAGAAGPDLRLVRASPA